MKNFEDQFGFVQRVQVEDSSDETFILCGLLPENSEKLAHFILHLSGNETVFEAQVRLLLHALQHRTLVRIRYKPMIDEAHRIIAVRLHAPTSD